MAKMGRPRNFDRDEAINQAMLLFWEHGYESTTLTLLKEGMGGISAPSFYAAFGSKESLFQEVVGRYIGMYGQVVASLWDESLPPKEAIEQSLRRSARMQTDRSHPLGCLLVLSASTCSPENRHIQKAMANERSRSRAGLNACVQRAITAGELAPATDPAVLGAVFYTFLTGISMQARDGVPLSQLNAAISQVMRVWDSCASDVCDVAR